MKTKNTDKKIKFTLTGTDNNGFRHRHSIKKNKNFKQAFLNFMEELGFDIEKIKKEFIVHEKDLETEEEFEYVLKVSDLLDVVWHYQNQKYDVDVFYGKAKLIIVGRTNSKIPMLRHLEKEASCISNSEAEKIRNSKKIHLPLQKSKNTIK